MGSITHLRTSCLRRSLRHLRMRCLLRRMTTAGARSAGGRAEVFVSRQAGTGRWTERGGSPRNTHLRIRRRSNRRCDRQRGGAWWPVILRDISDGVPIVGEVLRRLEQALPRRRQRRVVFLDGRHAWRCCALTRCCELLQERKRSDGSLRTNGGQQAASFSTSSLTRPSRRVDLTKLNECQACVLPVLERPQGQR